MLDSILVQVIENGFRFGEISSNGASIWSNSLELVSNVVNCSGIRLK